MGSLVGFNATNVTSGTIVQVDPVRIFGPQRDPMYIVLPITIMYTFIFLTGLFGNVFTCTVIIRNKSMHTATNYYLFSLAISDLLLLISGMPQEMYSIWSKWPYVFGPAFCLIRGLAAETSTNASVLTITLFTIERYLAICHPFVSHKMSKLSRATKHVVMLWVAALALALPQALQFGVRSYHGVAMCLQTRIIIQHSFEISTFVFFFAPMALITILYSLIGLRLRKSEISQEITGQESSRNIRFTPKVRRKQSQSTKRVIKMLVAVVAAFFICWAPFHAQRLVAIYGTDEHHRPKSRLLLKTYTILTYISGVFYYFSTSINPILYHIMSNKFRDAFKNTLVWCCGRGEPPALRCTYTTLALGRNPHSGGTDNSGNNSKDGTTRDSRIRKGCKTSLSSVNNIKFDPDCKVNYYLRNNSKKNRSIGENLGKDVVRESVSFTQKNKERNNEYEVPPLEPIYILSSGNKVEDKTREDNENKLSDEPEVYIKDIEEEKIIQLQKRCEL